MRLAVFLVAVVPLLAADLAPPLVDFTDVDPKSLGVVFVAAEKDPDTGFIVGGKNPTDRLAQIPAFNGRTIQDLEKDMRPGGLSRLGFLGKDERLRDVLALDNRYVVDDKGLTHQDLARPLHVLGAIAAKHGLDKPYEFTYRGFRFKATAQKFRGVVESPFDDGTKTNVAVVVENLTLGKSLSYSLLVPHLIERYGFYEGRGTPYRVEPRAILDLLKLDERPRGNR